MGSLTGKVGKITQQTIWITHCEYRPGKTSVFLLVATSALD